MQALIMAERKKKNGKSRAPQRHVRVASRLPKPKALATAVSAKEQPPAPAVETVDAAHELPAPIERERSSYDGDTAIKLYLREIGQVKLLTPQEEIELAARIKKGTKRPASR